MAWTANLKAVEKQNGQVHLVVELSDGTNTVTQDFFLNSVQNLKQLITQRINDLQALYTFADGLAAGNVDLTPDAVVPPTQAETDRLTFIVDYSKWQRVKKAIDVGLLTGSESFVAVLKTKVVSGFKPAYVDLL